jgi:CDP-diacylglycerol--serine O-phosphatidyltransferase
LPLIHSFLDFNWGLENPKLVAIYIGVVGLLMVSKVPTFSVEEFNLNINRKFFLRFFVGFAIIVMLMINFLWQFLSVVGVLYIFGIPVAVFIYRKNLQNKSNI